MSRFVRIAYETPFFNLWLSVMKATAALPGSTLNARHNHLGFAEERVKRRLRDKTDRKDFFHYVSLITQLHNPGTELLRS